MTTELETVATAFKQWRLKNKRGCIPSYLKQKILKLNKHYTFGQLAKALSVSISTLRRWCHPRSASSMPHTSNFVPLPLDSLSTTTEVSDGVAGIHLSMTLPNHLSLELKGLSLTQVSTLIKNFATGDLS